jgi:amidase
MPDVSEVAGAWWNLSTVEATVFHSSAYSKKRESFGPGFLDVLDYGSKSSGVEYARARKIKAEVGGRVNALLATVDCMICPSMSNSAQAKLDDPFKAETEKDWQQNVINDVHTKPFNFAGCPTLSVPCGFSSDGLPFSVQFVGRPLSEAVICRAGHAYEQATAWHAEHPDLKSG